MNLKDAIKSLHDQHGGVNNTADQKAKDRDKLLDLMKSMDKAKDAKAFEKIKKQAQKALQDIKGDLAREQILSDAWEDTLKTAKEQLAKEQKNLERTRDEMENNRKKCHDLNEGIKKYNQTPQGKKKPKPLLPELDPAKELKMPAQALDEAELDIGEQEGRIKLTMKQEKRDDETLKRFQTELDEKEFKDPKKK